MSGWMRGVSGHACALGARGRRTASADLTIGRSNDGHLFLHAQGVPAWNNSTTRLATTVFERLHFLGADDPDGLFAAIQRGRAGRKSVRIDTSSAPGDALSEAEAEAEDEAEEALSKAGAPPP